MIVTTTGGDNDEFEAMMRALRAIVNAPRLLLEQAGLLWMRATQDRFNRQGPGWQPLAERTIQGRRNKDKSSIRILQDEGDLMRSVVLANTGAEDAVYVLTERELIIGTSSVKANTHQYGNPDGFNRGINIPARPFFPTPDDIQPLIEERLPRLLDDLLSGRL